MRFELLLSFALAGTTGEQEPLAISRAEPVACDAPAPRADWVDDAVADECAPGFKIVRRTFERLTMDPDDCLETAVAYVENCTTKQSDDAIY